MIYGYTKKDDIFYFIEIYYKGDKENEDKKRIEKFIKEFS